MSKKCPEVYVSLPRAAWVGPRQVQQMGSRQGSIGSNEMEDLEAGRRASGEDSEAHEDHHSQVETSCSGEDEHPTDHMLRNLPEEDEQGISREERDEGIEAEEEMKRASKFSYFTIGIGGAGIISIFTGYLGHAYTIPLKVCTFFMLATFISGVSMLLLTWLHHSYRISIKTFKILKYITLGFLSLAMFDASFLFLKTFAILAFVPTLVILMIAFIMALYH